MERTLRSNLAAESQSFAPALVPNSPNPKSETLIQAVAGNLNPSDRRPGFGGLSAFDIRNHEGYLLLLIAQSPLSMPSFGPPVFVHRFSAPLRASLL